MSDKIKFSVRAKRVVYGDERVFFTYQVLMADADGVAGIEEGPDRTHDTAAEARRAGYAKVGELKKHRLFVIRITQKDIDDGEARSCRTCAIAQAIWRNHKRLGLNEYEDDVRVEPYGLGVDVQGIIFEKTRYPYARLISTVEGMPDLIIATSPRLYTESMYEWAVHWDEWAESRCMTAKEWREEHHDSKPCRPTPCSFVLDLDALKPDREKVATA